MDKIVKKMIAVAFVGPVIRCLELPNKAAMIQLTIEVYRPKAGGAPASMA